MNTEAMAQQPAANPNGHEMSDFTIDMRDYQEPSTTNPSTNGVSEPYAIGDCYNRSSMANEWRISDTQDMPYLAHIKNLSRFWRPLRHLGDWMEVGTEPDKWKSDWKTDTSRERGRRQERIERTNVIMIDFSTRAKLNETHLDSPDLLKNAFDADGGNQAEKPVFRLFLVEDLSRQVIESFGSRYDIDPLFFREQIGDYNWFNTRDPWAMPPNLLAGIKHRNWFRMRHMRFRYMDDMDTWERAKEEANEFNVFRRPDDDGNRWHYRDKEGAIISMTRFKTSIWVGKDPENKSLTVGIVLTDPTVTEGYPLWYGRVNWLTPPSMYLKSDQKPNEWPESLFDHIKQATSSYPWFPTSEEDTIDARIFAYPALYTICAEWLVIYEYLKARLSQIDWELEKPHVFRAKDDRIDSSLKRLHVWRRVLPVLREMLKETIEQALPVVDKLTGTSSKKESPLKDILNDFERVREALDELQRRVDRLTEVVAAEITTEDSRRGLKENHNLARLTWLATTFVPLSFLASFFSMTENIKELKWTALWFFTAAIPLTAVTLILAGAVGRGWLPKMKEKGQGVKKSTSKPPSKRL